MGDCMCLLESTRVSGITLVHNSGSLYSATVTKSSKRPKRRLWERDLLQRGQGLLPALQRQRLQQSLDLPHPPYKLRLRVQIRFDQAQVFRNLNPSDQAFPSRVTEAGLPRLSHRREMRIQVAHVCRLDPLWAADNVRTAPSQSRPTLDINSRELPTGHRRLTAQVLAFLSTTILGELGFPLSHNISALSSHTDPLQGLSSHIPHHRYLINISNNSNG
jgi:hypothetical protein